MKVLSRNELRTLVEHKGGPCVSIYMPMHDAGADIQKVPIQFKNLLREAEEQLRTQGVRDTELAELMAPAWRLMESRLTWRHPDAGFAMFLSRDLFEHYALPMKFEELVVANDRFHIKPLLRLFSCDGRFYLLALSQDEVRLMEGTRFGMQELSIGALPKNMHEALRFIDVDDDMRMQDASGRTQQQGGQGLQLVATGGKFTGTGHGASPEDLVDKKERYQEFFREVDKGLRPIIGEDSAPLILAAVEYLHPLYKSVNTYPHLLDKGLTGNPELLGANRLHELAWDLVQPYFTAEERQAVAKFQNLTGTGKTSTDLNEILAAANEGRVESLFVAVGVQEWGTYDYDVREMEVHQDVKPGDYDLLDLAATRSYLNGGRVFAVDPEAVPGNAHLAAIFRY